MALKQVFGHRALHVRRQLTGIHLAIADNPVGTFHTDEQKIAPAKSRWRVADNECFDIAQIHGVRSDTLQSANQTTR